MGQPLWQKGYTKLYVQVKERHTAFQPQDLPLIPTQSKARAKAKTPSKTAPAALAKGAAIGYPKATAAARGADDEPDDGQ